MHLIDNTSNRNISNLSTRINYNNGNGNKLSIFALSKGYLHHKYITLCNWLSEQTDSNDELFRWSVAAKYAFGGLICIATGMVASKYSFIINQNMKYCYLKCFYPTIFIGILSIMVIANNNFRAVNGFGYGYDESEYSDRAICIITSVIIVIMVRLFIDPVQHLDYANI